MQCPNCGAENRAIARFCQHCGSALPPAVAAEVPGAGEPVAASQPEVPGEAVLEEATGSQVVAQEQAATEEEVATMEQVAAREQVVAQEAAAVPERASVEQVAAGEGTTAAEQVVAQEPIGASEQPAAEGLAAEQPLAQEEAVAVEQAVAAEQSVAQERAGGGGEQAAAEGAAIGVPAEGPLDAETAEQPVRELVEERAPGATLGSGTAPDEGPREEVAYRAEDEVETDMPEDTMPEAGLQGEAEESAMPETRLGQEAEAEAATQRGEASNAEAPSAEEAAAKPAAEAELQEADVLPWRDEPALPASLEPGTVIDGRYRIVELLATDEAGALYSARDLRRCPQCGFGENSPDQAFCAACGAVLDQKPLVRILQHPPGQDPPPDVEVLDHVAEGERAFWVWKEPGKHTDVLGGSEEPMRLDIGQRTHPGQARELDEDSLLTLALTRTFESSESASALFVVADGMGGHEAGEVASRIAIRALADAVLRDVFVRELAGADLNDEAVQGALQRAVQVANEQVFLERERRENDMGTTVTAALLRDWTLFIAHVGDCRAYRWGKDGLQQLTTDHSVIASMVASGAAQPEEVYTHPHRSVIYRSVGDQPSVEVDLAVLSVEPGDRLVLCCDGLWETLRDDGIEEVLLREADPQRACDAMVDQANEAGGPDNISVIVVQL